MYRRNSGKGRLKSLKVKRSENKRLLFRLGEATRKAARSLNLETIMKKRTYSQILTYLSSTCLVS